MRAGVALSLTRRMALLNGQRALQSTNAGVPPFEHHTGVQLHPEVPKGWQMSDRPGRFDHGENFLPGPPFTYDEVPVPHLPYEQEKAKMNAKLNQYAGVGVLMCIGYVLLQYAGGSLDFEPMMPPKMRNDS